MTTQINNLGIVFPDNTTQTTASASTTLPTPGVAGQLLTSDGTDWTSAPPAVPPVATTALSVPYSGLTGTVPTWNQNTTGNAATADDLNTGAVLATPASGDFTTGVFGWPTFNQNTTGNAATATTAANALFADDLNTGAVLATPASGDFSTGTFTWPTFNQNTTGTAATATLATASTNLKNGAVGAVPYQSAADTTAFLSIGTTGQVLSVSAGGLPTWTTAAAATPGTPLNSVQYNSASAFAGSANMTFDGTTLTLANNALINSVAVGQGLTSGLSNTAVGINALKLNTASDNTAVGFNAGAAITTGSYNAMIGANAGKLITNGIFNVFVGPAVGQSATGSRQTGVGAAALQNCTTGERNVGIGFAALLNVTSGGSNTAIGTSALQASTGGFNTAVGNSAGISMTTGSNNTLMGGYTGFNAALDIRTLSNYIVLSDGLGNANLYIDNNKNTILAGTVRTAGYTVGTLPAGVVGMRAYVTDANATTFYSVVASGGANVVPVFYNGANWVIA